MADSSDSGSVDEQELSEAIGQQEDEQESIPFGFVVAITTTDLRRLHFVGACGRAPGQHFRNYILYGDRVPKSHEFDKACLSCFGRKGHVTVPDVPTDGNSDVSESDDSSSTPGG